VSDYGSISCNSVYAHFGVTAFCLERLGRMEEALTCYEKVGETYEFARAKVVQGERTDEMNRWGEEGMYRATLLSRTYS
jgi:hypothetical protein